MKIRTQFIINIAVLGIILFFVSAGVIITNQSVENTHQQEILATQIEREAYELGFLANDYLLYRESQQANRWESKFASFSDNLSKVQVNTPEQQALLANIRTNQHQLEAVFAEVRASIESAPQTQEAGFDEKFMQVSWSRLEVQNQGMIFNTSRLERILNKQEHQLERLTKLLSLVLLGVLGVFLLVNYGLTFRRTLQGIARLQTGTRIIGSGDLDFAIAVNNEDEIGELSHAFNQMTASLKQVTASKADLEKEIMERKQAENLVQTRMRLMEFAATHSLEEILQETLDEIGKITNSPIGFYHFVEADQQTLSLQTWSTRTLQEFCTAQGKGLHYNVSDAGVWVDCIHQRRPVIHNNYASLPNRKGLPEGHAQVIRELVVPILRGDRIVSILGVGNKPSNYTEKDVELVSYLADVAWEIAEHKRAEEEITRLSKFPAEDPYPVLRVQNDGRLIYANAASYELLKMWHCGTNGYLPEELKDQISAAVESKSDKILSIPCDEKVYSITLVPVFDSGYVNFYGSDITERKRAEEALRESELRHRSLFENMLSGYAYCQMLFDQNNKPVDFTYLNVNAAFETLTGLKSVEGKNVSEVIPGIRESNPELIETYGRVSQTGKPERFETHIPALGIWFSVAVYSPKQDYFVAVFDNITERKQAEAKISDLAKFPTENPHPILRVETDGRITYANAASQELLDVWHCQVNDYLPEALRDFTTVAVDDHLNKTVDVVCNDKVYSIMLVPIVESGYVNIYGRDITERKRAEEALQRITEDLRRSNAELEQFAYVASHDLQEPLRMISSYVQLLARRYQGKLDSDADEFIAFAVDGAKRMQNLINDLLAYSRVGTRGNPLTPVSAEDLVKESLANLQFSLEESGASITHEPLPVVKGDFIQLVMVFQNLLGNAIKFRGPEPLCIHIGVREEAGEWIFSVRDNGIGIDPKFAERIFIIFQRLNDRAAYPGTGIGLAICKRVIQRHGGRIWVESEPGQGATFYFTLPIKETL